MSDRYRDLGDGTIRDTRTRLHWRRDPLEPGETVRRRWRLPAGLRRRLDAARAPDYDQDSTPCALLSH